jgi:hypothetical protein
VRPRVQASLDKFNRVDRKDGLRDMCEIVELETRRVFRVVARKGVMRAQAQRNGPMGWSDVINLLASNNSYIPPAVPVVDETLKIELHAFRSARNLVDHPPSSAWEGRRTQAKYMDKMMQGARLITELLACQRRASQLDPVPPGSPAAGSP